MNETTDAAAAFVPTEVGALPRPSPIPEEGLMWECIALDPGGTSGWCQLSIHEIAMYSDEYKILENIVRWSAGEITGTVGHQIDQLVDLCEAWEGAEIVSEDFIVRTANSSREVLDPVRIMEPLKWWIERGGQRAWDTHEDDWQPRMLHLQQPSLAMSTVTDDRLKAYGMYSLTAGKPHARDALRHALTFARRRKLDLTRLSAAVARIPGHDYAREANGQWNS